MGVIFSLRRRESIALGGEASGERGAPAVVVSFADDGQAAAFTKAISSGRLGAAAALSSADFNRRLIRVVVGESALKAKADTDERLPTPSRWSDADHIRLAVSVLEELPIDIPTVSQTGSRVKATATLRDLVRDGHAQLFPLHDPAALQSLRSRWGVLDVPLDDIAGYLGPASGIYFAFLHTITLALLPSAVLGCLLWIAASLTGLKQSGAAIAAAYACLNALWATVTLKVWRRREATLAQRWGVLDAEEDEILAAAAADAEGAPAAASAPTPGRSQPVSFKSFTGGTSVSESSSQPKRESTVMQLSRFALGSLPIMILALAASLAYLFALERFRVGLEAALSAPLPTRLFHAVSGFSKAFESSNAAVAAVANKMAAGFATEPKWQPQPWAAISPSVTPTSDAGFVDSALLLLDRSVEQAVNWLLAWPLSSSDTARALLSLSRSASSTTTAASPPAIADLLPLRWSLLLQRLPWLVFTISVLLLNNLGGKLAQWLTAREYHSTSSEASDAVAVKRLVLTGLTSFFSIAFVCFWQQDMAQVKQRLLSIFVISLASNLPELLGPQLRGGAALVQAKAAGTVGHARVDTQDLAAIAAEARSTAGTDVTAQESQAVMTGPDSLARGATSASQTGRSSHLHNRRGNKQRAAAAAMSASGSLEPQAEAQGEAQGGARRRLPIEQRAAGLISPARLAPISGLAEAVAHIPDHLNRAQLEASLPPYNPHEDTEEVLLLFGFSLFAAAFPLAPALALLVLGLEMWVDKRKALSVQRPMPTRRASLGVYNTAFSALEMLAIASNMAIAYIFWTQKTSGGGSSGNGDETRTAALGQASQPASHDATAKLHAAFWFVLLEHAIACIKVLIDKALPDVPEEVRLAARRQQSGSRLAAERHLSRPGHFGASSGGGSTPAESGRRRSLVNHSTDHHDADIAASAQQRAASESELPVHQATVAAAPPSELAGSVSGFSIAQGGVSGGRSIGVQQVLDSFGALAVTTAV